MKVLFLDVDGVLNTYGNGSLYTLNKNKMHMLSYIIKQTKAEIVISSTWRLDPFAMSRLSKRLNYKNARIYGVTPRSPTGFRGQEIRSWLREHPEVSKYCILDDDDDDFFEDQKEFFVQTDGNIGLTLPIAMGVIECLNS